MHVRQLLNNARRYQDAQQLAEISYPGLTDAQLHALRAGGFSVYSGKVRDVIFKEQQATMIHSDRLSAFDCFVGYVPFRGQILAALTKWWADRLQQDGVPVTTMKLIHPRVIRAPALDPIRIEIIVRGYLAGSLLRDYQSGARDVCGIKLPDGLKAYQKLPHPIITPTTKAAAYQHDEPISPDEIVRLGLCSDRDWQEISRAALQAFAIGTKVYSDAGWLLVDTKYEFGRRADGKIEIIDEIHTPDSSRLWEAKSFADRLAKGEAPVMLDKEIVRRWLLEQGFSGQGVVPRVPSEIIIQLSNAYLDVAEAILNESIAASITAPDPVGLAKN
jgi:phosphoribosylaminoimidazole-succinocarboxamide synthase